MTSLHEWDVSRFRTAVPLFDDPPRVAAGLISLHRGAGRRGCVFLEFGDEDVGGEHEAGDAGGVDEGRLGDEGGIEDAGLHEVEVLAGGGVEAVVALEFLDLLDDDIAVEAGVLGDLTAGGLDSAEDDIEAELLVFGLGLLLRREDRVLGAEKGDATAGDVAVLGGGAGGLESVVDEVLGRLHRGFGRAADGDDRHAAGQLGKALHELLAVVVAGGLLVLGLDLVSAGLDLGLLASAFDDRGVVLGDDDLLGAAEFLEFDGLDRR